MKLLPIVLLQCVTAAAAVVVYDQVREDAPREGTPLADAGLREAAALERRLQALEAARTPTLRASDPDAALLARVEALEAAAPAPPQPPLPPGEGAEDEGLEADTGRAEPDTVGAREAPTAAEVQRFRTLREIARREDELQKNRERVDRMLEKAGLSLSTRQREQVHAAYAAFQPRIDEIWTEAKQQAQATIAAGGKVERSEVVASTHALIEQAFVTQLEDFVPGVDASAVAQALVSGRK